MKPAHKKIDYTITEAARELGVSRAAVHEAIKTGRLNAEWTEIAQTIRKKALVVSAKDLRAFRVSESHQLRGKKPR